MKPSREGGVYILSSGSLLPGPASSGHMIDSLRNIISNRLGDICGSWGMQAVHYCEFALD